jgi:hypothetical protein
MNQNQIIINYLKPFGRKLTRLKCYELFGFMTLNSRASEIKKLGYPIQSRLVTNKKGQRYSEYFFV